mgnify:CR=1 FL=1
MELLPSLDSKARMVAVRIELFHDKQYTFQYSKISLIRHALDEIHCVEKDSVSD